MSKLTRTYQRLLRRFVHNDLTRLPGVTVAITLVLTLSSFLMASGSLIVERVSAAVTHTADIAQPPHLLQMHRGAYDIAELERFAQQRDDIAAWQIEDMLGYAGHRLSWSGADGSGGDLSERLIDNLFVTAGGSFDLLIDARTHEPARARPGEVFIPVSVERELSLTPGDILEVSTDGEPVTFRVAGSVKDAQMASSLSSATRFLVHESDWNALSAAGGATPEIIVEYRVTDTAHIDSLQRAYEADDTLPANGQAVTDTMIRLVNVISDGLTALALMFASLMLMGLALVSLHFVIRGSLEQDAQAIGTLRAIGIPHRTIRGLYLARYAVMAGVAGVVGFGAAWASEALLTASVRASFIPAPVTPLTVLVPFLGTLLVLVLVIATCSVALRAAQRIEVMSSLRGRVSLRRASTRASRPSQLGSTGRALNARLALIDLRSTLRQWILIPIIFAGTTLLVTLPLNVWNTFNSPSFITYMGSEAADIRADVSGSSEAAVTEALAHDDRIASVHRVAITRVEALPPNGADWTPLRVEVGDFSASTLEYVTGTAPSEGWIALSVLNAERLEVSQGDALTVRVGDEVHDLVVSGVYQDVTGGGFSAKLHAPAPTSADQWVLLIDVADDAAVAQVVHDLTLGDDVTVIPMEAYVDQTLSYTTNTLGLASLLTLVFGAGAAALITALFLRLRIAAARQEVASLLVTGFSIRDVAAQWRWKTGVTVTFGVLVGVWLTETVGAFLVSMLLSNLGIGIAQFELIASPLLTYVAYPLILIAFGLICTRVVSTHLHTVTLREWITA